MRSGEWRASAPNAAPFSTVPDMAIRSAKTHGSTKQMRLQLNDRVCQRAVSSRGFRTQRKKYARDAQRVERERQPSYACHVQKESIRKVQKESIHAGMSTTRRPHPHLQGACGAATSAGVQAQPMWRVVRSLRGVKFTVKYPRPQPRVRQDARGLWASTLQAGR